MSNVSQESIEFEGNELFQDDLNPGKILPVIRECVKVSKNDSEIIRAVEVALCKCIKNYPVNDLEEIFGLVCPSGASVFVRKVTFLEERPNPDVDECLGVFSVCRKIISYFQEAFLCLNQSEKIAICRVGSLLKCSFDVLLKCFFHCKGSEGVYGPAFHSLTDSLSGFFKNCCSLLDVLLDFMTEKSVVDLESESEISLLDELLSQVSKCGIVMINLEVKAMAKIWKTYVYLVEKYSCVLMLNHKIGETINELCKVIMSNLEGLKDEDNTKLVKLCCFLLKLIMKLCEIFKSGIRRCHESLFNLLLMLCKCDGGLMVDKNEKEDLLSQLTIGADPLLSFFLGDECLVREFGKSRGAHHSEEFCLLCCLVLKKLSHSSFGVRCLWINERENIFEWLFKSASSSQFVGFSSVRLPNVLINWQQVKFTDLYEYVLVTVSAFLITASADEFTLVEKTLIRNVLQPRLVPALLAMDVWCFLARIAESDLCYHQILVLSEMYKKIHPETERVEKYFLASLIRRLFLFLTDTRQKEYLKRFPPSFHSSVWGALAVRSVPQDEVCDILRPLVSQCCHLTTKTEARFVQGSSGNEHVVYLTFGPQILDLWKFNSELLSSDCESVSFLKIACALFACIVSFVPPEELLTVLGQMKKLLSVREQPTPVKLYMGWILNALSSVSIPAGGSQKRIIATIAEIFRELLSSREMLAKQKAVEIFESFTRLTSHEEVIAMTVRDSPQLKMEMLAYLNKKPDIDCPADTVRESLGRLFKLEHEHVCQRRKFECGSGIKRIKLDGPDLEVVIARFREEGDVIREWSRSLSEVQKREIQNICSSILSALK